jgi:hypothetical protein
MMMPFVDHHRAPDHALEPPFAFDNAMQPFLLSLSLSLHLPLLSSFISFSFFVIFFT